MTALTVLTTLGGRAATKTLCRGEDGAVTKAPATMSRLFNVRREPVDDISDLACVLEQLAADPCSFVIRGEPCPGIDLRRPVRRLKYPDPDDDTPATFRSSPHGERWLCADFDKVPTIAGADPIHDPESALQTLTWLLPPEFHGVTFWGQFSSSAGLDGWRTMSAHLWFMLSDPVTDDDLNAWAANADIPIDRRLFNAVQPHYTAAPILDGIDDPIRRRCCLVEGAFDDVPLDFKPSGPTRTCAPAAQRAASKAMENVVEAR
jgi:hypothetical protein